MNPNNIYQRLIKVHNNSMGARGCIDAACELILKRLEEPGSIDLVSVLAVLEAGRDTQDEVTHEVAQLSAEIEAESGISANQPEPMESVGGQS